MPPTGQPYSMWVEDDYDSPDVILDCLLPTGIMIQMIVHKDATILSIKQDLFTEAQKYPLFNQLKNKVSYVFVCINEVATRVELVDESRRLCDIRPFQPMLKLVEITSSTNADKQQNLLNAQISVLMGKGLNELDSIEIPEVVDFRKHMREMCEGIARDKETQGWLERAMCLYPPDVDPNSELSEIIKKQLENEMLRVLVTIENTTISRVFQILHAAYPDELVRMTIDKHFKTTGEKFKDEDYILKVCGREEYFLGPNRLSQFMHVRRAIAKGQNPELIAVHKDNLIGVKPVVPTIANAPAKPRAPPETPAILRNKEQKMRESGHCLWDLKDQFSINLVSLANVNLPEYASANVRVGLYHGWDNLCKVVTSSGKRLQSNAVQLNESIPFEISLQNVPCMARLCFLVYTTPDKRVQEGKKNATIGKIRKDGKKEIIPLAWVNIPVFDYKGVLRQGEHKLYMWSCTDDDILSDELLNPIGTVESNSQKEESICLVLSFPKFNVDGHIYYPPFDKVLEVAALNSDGAQVLDPKMVTKSKLGSLQKMIDRHPLHVLHDQDKELIWSLRLECREHFPQSLPKLITCVKWDNHIDVALLQSLLQIWQPLPPTDALELLDFQYADKSVRKFAVRCLREMSDSELCQYLLQFVQVLKYESYLECDLIEFLLQKALRNHKIGHYFFWLLRSEMHIPSVSVRFGLILEAYCRGNHYHLVELTKETEALGRLHNISSIVKKLKGLTKEELKIEIEKILKNNQYRESLSSFNCPLDPCLRLNTLVTDQCRSMDSKMRPLWLEWENPDKPGDQTARIRVMYKKGDDLRQDMLTLQILRIMDNIWQSEGLDLRLNAYGCLPTGHEEGLIEIVTEARTLAHIQKEYPGMKVRSAFNKECIYQWLTKKNKTPAALQKAMQEFMMSCVGYCVATYVLGVADRHSDNIMVRENGQLFHIDFGHILGHFKSKLGIKRERVPFVLTADFVYVIKFGPERSDDKFNQFQALCERAFLILHERSKFLITLFMMMMNTGIPEVSSMEDIEYLTETLVPDMPNEEALAHFQAKFREALRNSWKTSINWMIHNIHCNN